MREERKERKEMKEMKGASSSPRPLQGNPGMSMIYTKRTFLRRDITRRRQERRTPFCSLWRTPGIPGKMNNETAKSKIHIIPFEVYRWFSQHSSIDPLGPR